MVREVGAYWVVPPRQLLDAYQRYGDRVFDAISAVADYSTQKMQREARQNAPWTDRTGNARRGLFSVYRRPSKFLIEIYLAHTVEYGKYLELAHGGKYAIIVPTIARNLGIINKMLKDIFR